MPRISESHVTPYFENKFKKLPKNIQRLATKKILLFENNPTYSSLHTHKLKGELKDFWAFYITKKYRTLFRFISDSKVIYYDIDTHEIYK